MYPQIPLTTESTRSNAYATCIGCFQTSTDRNDSVTPKHQHDKISIITVIVMSPPDLSMPTKNKYP